jgi:hypothetical protein
MRHAPAPSAAARLTMLLASALIVQILPATNLASAQSPVSAIKDFGLIGTWADNCNANPGPSNQHASFSTTARGTIMLRNDFGPDYGDMVYRIVDAKRLGQFRISLRQLLITDDQIALDTVMMKAKDRIRIWSSRGIDGSEYVQDGLVPAANNRETGWMERCDTRSANTMKRRRPGQQATPIETRLTSIGMPADKSSAAGMDPVLPTPK